jgi:hypothetical protein
MKKVNPSHPRLYINSSAINKLKELDKTDSFFHLLKDALIKKADRLKAEDTVEFRITGPRMLKNCQEILDRVTTLSLAFHLTGEKTYASRAGAELLSAAAFPHWNKDHFLDTAELITAFAIGYDWLFHILPAGQLDVIKDAMITKGIRPGLEEHHRNIWWAAHRYNWNQVCNGGLIIGALSIADEETGLSRNVFDATAKQLPIAFESFGNDGGWEGGPDYWQYTTWYSALLIDALDKVISNDYGLTENPGFKKTGLFPLYMAGPRDTYFNFADAAETYAPLPALFWLGDKFKITACINENHRLLRRSLNEGAEPNAFNLVWYVPEKVPAGQLPAGRLFSGINVASLRSSWENPNASFIGLKGGYNQADHAHLDLGSFVFDMNGERWVTDLGRDNYDLPGYFDPPEGGGRWKYFRLNTLSHNTLVLNNDIQRASAKAGITEFKMDENGGMAAIDLSQAYTPHASKVSRTITLNGELEIRIKDEILWSSKHKTARWQILTDAVITLNANRAVLSKGGKKITAALISPAGGKFEVISAEQESPEMKNQGYKLLIVRKDEEGALTEFEVSFKNS